MVVDCLVEHLLGLLAEIHVHRGHIAAGHVAHRSSGSHSLHGILEVALAVVLAVVLAAHVAHVHVHALQVELSGLGGQVGGSLAESRDHILEHLKVLDVPLLVGRRLGWRRVASITVGGGLSNEVKVGVGSVLEEPGVLLGRDSDTEEGNQSERSHLLLLFLEIIIITL